MKSMSVGVQKEINCPVVQNCSWKGNIMESFTHCTRQHPNCVLHPRACKVNLTQGIDERKILKLSNDQLLTLHVVCGKEIGVSVINLAAEGSKQGSYNITLKSLDGCCETIVRNIEILGHNEPKTSRSIPQLNFVEMLLEFYVKEANDNGFIYGCRNDPLANNLNVSIDYGLVNTDYIYNCPHGIYGCNFLGKVETMKVHQRGCKLFKCFVKTCEWIGIQDNVYNHIRDKHAVSKNCITLDVNDLMDDNVFFFKTNHGLIFVHIKMDQVPNMVAISANCCYPFGQQPLLKILFGNDIMYEIEVMNFKGNYEWNSAHVVVIHNSVFAKYGCAQIKVDEKLRLVSLSWQQSS